MAEESVKVPIDGDSSGFDKEVEGMKGTISAASVAMGNLLADLGKKALSAFGNMVSSGDEFNKAINQMAASTGAVGTELEGMRDVVKDVYGNNFGESYDDVANAVAEISKQTGLMGDELQSATESAFLLSDAFEFDVQESTKSAKSMMSNFGISAEEAYNLIAVGAQKGADSSGELLDTLNEYSADAVEAGLTAEQFASTLIAGADSGVYSIDKIGDAIREMNTTVKDGTAAEALQALGLNADDMAARFAAGGDTAQKAFEEVVTALNSTTDPLARNNAAVGLMGSIYEDTGDGIITALAAVSDTSVTAADALGKINEVKYDDVGSAIEGLKRTFGKATIDVRSTLSSGLADAIGGLVNTINSADGDVGKIFDGIVDAAKTALGSISPVLAGWKDKGKELIGKLISGIVENLPKIKGKAVDIVIMLADSISQNTSGFLDAAKSMIDGILTAIQTFLPELLPLAVQMIEMLIKGLSDALVMLMEYVPQIVTSIVEIITTNLPLLIEAAIQILTALITGITDNLPLIVEGVIGILTSMCDIITENLPTILEAALTILMALVQGITDNLPVIIDAALNMIMALVQGLIDNLPELIDAAIDIIDSLVNGLVDNLGPLIDSALDIVMALFDGIVENLPKILEAGGKIITRLVRGIALSIPKILEAVPRVISAIWDTITETDWIQLGKDILGGLADGLWDGLSTIAQTIKDICSQIWDDFKSYFGINSPSKLMRDTVGRFLLPGVSVGIADTSDDTAETINQELDHIMEQIDARQLQAQIAGITAMHGANILGTALPSSSLYASQQQAPNTLGGSLGGGDLIIPVSIGGESLETVVITAAQIANARSGGGTI
nr:MAG TPA: tail tape measure protein [Caudoviricetes sp.]